MKVSILVNASIGFNPVFFTIRPARKKKEKQAK